MSDRTYSRWPRGVVAAFLAATTLVSAQTPTPITPPEDENIEAIRKLATIGEPDKRVINEWIKQHVEKLGADAKKGAAALSEFRERVHAQYHNPSNTPAFQTELARQVADIASAELAKPNLDAWVARALARVLADLERPEGVSALATGLRSKDAAARLLCAKALAGQKAAVAADKEGFEKVVSALREAALAEPSPAVLSQLYTALAFPPPPPGSVGDAYLAILEKRLGARRGSAVLVDAAEIDAYEYFRAPGVLAALNAEQKQRLVVALAALMRLDAERYQADKLDADEKETIERRLDGAEALLAEIAGKGGDVRGELAAGGHERRAEVLKQVYVWVGDAKQQAPGTLNAAPWNVAVGAP